MPSFNQLMDSLPEELSIKILKTAYSDHVKNFRAGFWRFHVRCFKKKRTGLVCDRRYKTFLMLTNTLSKRIDRFFKTVDNQERRYLIDKFESLIKKNAHFAGIAGFERIKLSVIEMSNRLRTTDDD